MTKNKKIGIVALAIALVVILGVVVFLGRKGNFSNVAKPAPPEAEDAVDVFSRYVHTDMGANGEYLQVTILNQDDTYAMVEKYRDVGGQFFYKTHTLSDYDKERFQENIMNFNTVKQEPDTEGAYVSGTVTFASSAGDTNYLVEPFDLTGYGVETNPDPRMMITNVEDDMNRLMPVKDLGERLALSTNAELGGYLRLVYNQIADQLYEGDATKISEAWHTIYGVTLSDKESSDGTYVLEVSCNLGTYEAVVTDFGYVCSLTQTESAEDADLASKSVTKTVE